MATVTFVQAGDSEQLFNRLVVNSPAASLRSATSWMVGTTTGGDPYVVQFTGTGFDPVAGGTTYPTAGTITGLTFTLAGVTVATITGLSVAAASVAPLLTAPNLTGLNTLLLAGDDTLTGGDGNDSLRGREGADRLDGGAGNDSLVGDGGDDIFIASAGRDTVAGGAGIDLLSGAALAQALHVDMASNANPTVVVFDIERVTGSDFADTLTGTSGAQTLIGGLGDDLIQGGAGDDSLIGNAGLDTASYAGASGAVTVSLALAGPQDTGGAGIDTLVAFENLLGGNLGDTLTGNGGANVLEGGQGNDLLTGGDGRDTLSFERTSSAVTVSLVNTQFTAGSGLGADTVSGFEDLRGGSGSDTLTGDATANRIEGMAGFDTLDGADGADTLLGGEGNDSLLGGTGDDDLDGGAGTDLANYAAFGDDLTVSLALTLRQDLGEAGQDLLLNIENLTTGAGNDSVTGSAGANVLTLGAGNDTVEAGAGNDTITGGDGLDLLSHANAMGGVLVSLANGTTSGAAGVDSFSGFEMAAGGAFGDSLTGTGNADTLQGLGGGDTILGGSGNDLLDGGAGRDLASFAGSFSSIIVRLDTPMQTATGAGADTLLGFEDAVGSEVADTLVGDAGDNLLAGGGGGDSLVGGEGLDTASYFNATFAVTVSLAMTGGQNTGGGGVDTLVGFEALVGGQFNDQLTGDAGANTLEGGLGADTLNGGAGEDVASYAGAAAGVAIDLSIAGAQAAGPAGADRLLAIENLSGSGFADTLAGDDGNNSLGGAGGDDVLMGGAGDDTLEGGEGLDTADYGGAPGPVAVSLAEAGVQEVAGLGLHQLVSIENLRGSAEGGDMLAGNAGANVLEGLAGDDSLAGAAGADTLRGGADHDTLAGELGDDRLIGGAGNDVLLGGEGRDTADYSGAAAGVRVSLAVTTVQNTLAEGSDRLEEIENLAGSAFGDTLIGDAGANLLSASGGDDRLEGGAGGDTLLGGTGADTLVVGTGDDGFALGGSGDDRFVFAGPGGPTLVEDLVGTDVFDVRGALAGAQIDLRFGATSQVDGRAITIGASELLTALDIVFLQDLSGSFSDDIISVRALVPDVVAAVRAVQADSRFGVASFVDKAVNPFGSGTDYTYRQDLALTAEQAGLAAAYGALTILSGGDGPEAQIEALMQLSLRASEIGYRGEASRFVVLFTDAPFHVAGDGAAGGITTPNNGDTVLDGSPPGTGEDYPGLAQLRAALAGAGLIPIFAIAGGSSVEAPYQALVADLGFGAVTPLTSNSSNIVSVLTTGLGATTVSIIENAEGSAFADTITGNDGANRLEGLLGNDRMDGLGGADTILGGAGSDVMEGGAGFDLASYADATKAVIVDLSNIGTQATGLGNDRLSGFEGLIGGRGADRLTGDAAANLLIGGLGADTLVGGGGNDTLRGEAGADSLVGGVGLDMADYSLETLGLVVSLAMPALSTRSAAGDTFALVEGVLGGAGGDSLTGDAMDNRLEGQAGGDRLFGDAGADTLLGGDGNDTLLGGAGNDSMAGGAGFDMISYADAPGPVNFFLDSFPQNFGHGVDSFSEIEGVIGSAGADSLRGNGANNRLEGGDGADTLQGGTGADTLDGGLGADLFRFTLTNDSTNTLPGRDRILGFNTAQGDRIDVSAIDANTLLTGNQAFLLVAGDFTGVAGEISVARFGTENRVRFDTNGDGAEDFAITVISTVALTAESFIL